MSLGDRAWWLPVLCWMCMLHQMSAASAAEACPTGIQIYVVHNCLIWPDQDWALLIRSQLDHLQRSGLTDCAITNVALSVPALHANFTYEELEDLLNSGRQLVHTILPSINSATRTGVIVSQVHENSYEFPGIHLLWQLAQVSTTTPITYSVRPYLHACATGAKLCHCQLDPHHIGFRCIDAVHLTEGMLHEDARAPSSFLIQCRHSVAVHSQGRVRPMKFNAQYVSCVEHCQ